MADDDKAINAVKNAVLDLLLKRIAAGDDPEICATGTAAAAALIYASMMGGVKVGREEDAKALFGGWFVDMIIGANRDEWAAAVQHFAGGSNG